MGDRELTTGHAAARRHALRIRTVAVSFAAAVRSARRDLRVGPAERDALIEAWRVWSLETLDEYAAEVADLTDHRDPAVDDGRTLDEELAEAYRTVRDA